MPPPPATTRPPGMVRAINTVGSVAQRVGVAPSLDEQSLLDAAAKSTRLRDFGPEAFREGLRVLVTALDDEARLTTIGRIAARRRLIGLLQTRLRLIEYRRRHAGVAEQRITRPIF